MNEPPLGWRPASASPYEMADALVGSNAATAPTAAISAIRSFMLPPWLLWSGRSLDGRALRALLDRRSGRSLRELLLGLSPVETDRRGRRPEHHVSALTTEQEGGC